MKKILFIIFIFTTSVSLVACADKVSDKPQDGVRSITPASSLVASPRVTDKKILELGESVYLQHCSQCHGKKAEGTSEWKTPDDQGRYPPPPLNGTAHAWHHPTEVLVEIIKDGTVPDGNMPAWEGKLTDDEILAVIAWFQSIWPEKIFTTWQEIDLSSRED